MRLRTSTLAGLVGAAIVVAILIGDVTTTPLAAAKGAVAEAASPVVFGYTGGSQFWTVPAGVTEIGYVVLGAAGGSGRGAGSGALAGGYGARVAGGIYVTPGETLSISVGGAGGPGTATAGGLGGFGGGGAGGAQGGGGGGGATAIKRGSMALVLAAGGGGAGGSGDVTLGGNGGDSDRNGQPASDCSGQNVSGEGGLMATSGSGGAGGAGALPGTIFAASAGGAGGSGQGGAGGYAWNGGGGGLQSGGGGGGGGGVFGGGGGGGGTLITSGAGCGTVGAGGGGGGGSSLRQPGDALLTGVVSGNGMVTIFPGGPQPLFFSEYVKDNMSIAVEIYNPGPSPVTLTDRYRLVVGGTPLNLGGSVAPGDVWVVSVLNGIDPALQAVSDQVIPANFVLFGQPSIELRGSATVLDEINVGAAAADMCSTSNRRRPAINSGFTGGKPFVCSDEYEVDSLLSLAGLGTHSPTLSIGDATATESTSDTLQLPVTLPRPYPLPVSVEFTTAAGSAVVTSDFTSTAGTLLFAPGETAKTVDVPVTSDDVHEVSEQLTVLLSNPVNAVITDGTATATILDDDPLPAVAAGDDSASTATGVVLDVDVRSNDTASVGELSDPQIIAGPANGTATSTGGGVRYTSTAGFTGIDQISYRVCSTWTPSVCSSATLAVSVSPEIVGIVPGRLMDTRPDGVTVDGQFAAIGQRDAGSVTELVVAGRGGVAADSSSVVLNVTATQVAGPGFVTVWPCGSTRPLASNLNVVTGQTVPNAVIAKLGTGGKVCLFTSSATHLVVDVNAYFPQASTFVPGVPARLLDSRPGEATVDGAFAGIGTRPATSTTELSVEGRGGVPGGAGAVVLNVTATGVTGPGFVTVWPCGSTQPLASNLNVVPGRTVPNVVISKVGAGGKVCLFTRSALDLVVDVDGYFPAQSSFAPTVPARFLDSRPGEATIDGRFSGSGLRVGGSVTELVVGGRDAVPVGATTVALNVTATDVREPGYVTVWPCGSSQPLASTLNLSTGETVPNAVVARLGTGGTLCLFTSADTHLIVDVSGYFM